MSTLLQRSLSFHAERLQAEASGLLGWWLQEAQSLGRGLLSRVSTRRRQRLVFDLAAEKPVASLYAGAHVEQTIDLDGISTLMERPRGLGAPPKAATTIILRQSAFLDFCLWLPLAAERQLDSAVELQLEHRLPLPRDGVYARWEIVAKDAANGRMLVAVAVAKKSVIDDMERRISAWGFRPASIIARHATGRPFELLPRKLKQARLFRNPREKRWAFSACGLLLLCGIAAGIQAYREHAVITAVSAPIHERAQAARQLRAALEQQQAPLIALQRLMAQPDAASALTLLSRAVPADSWVYQFDFNAVPDRPASARLAAYTPAAPGLVQTLQAVPDFARVELLTAISTGQEQPMDRVEVALTWKHEGAP